MRLDLGTPVVAALSAVGEERWGFHQFPNLTRTPDGTILLTWADAADASETHGQPAPVLGSTDQGRTWEPFGAQPRPTRPHFCLSSVFNGEYLAMPSAPYLNMQQAGVALPAPLCTANVYGTVRSYRVADLPPRVQDYYHRVPGLRWSPAGGQWTTCTIAYDPKDMLAWNREGSDVLPRTFFERPLLRHGSDLLYADYRVRYALPDGTVPPKGATHLMVSEDNGRSFHPRATVAADPSGRDLYGEPQLAPTADGRLVCVLRKTDQEQKPMAITWSADNGRTWSAPRDLFTFGVWPCVLLLGCGTLALSYGRPGVHLRLDPSGTGLQWSEPITLIEGSHQDVHRHTCGYTSLLALDERSFLIAYSDFLHRDTEGQPCKAILVRRVTVAEA
jgi:hypothetical protein